MGWVTTGEIEFLSPEEMLHSGFFKQPGKEMLQFINETNGDPIAAIFIPMFYFLVMLNDPMFLAEERFMTEPGRTTLRFMDRKERNELVSGELAEMHRSLIPWTDQKEADYAEFCSFRLPPAGASSDNHDDSQLDQTNTTDGINEMDMSVEMGTDSDQANNTSDSTDDSASTSADDDVVIAPLLAPMQVDADALVEEEVIVPSLPPLAATAVVNPSSSATLAETIPLLSSDESAGAAEDSAVYAADEKPVSSRSNQRMKKEVKDLYINSSGMTLAVSCPHRRKLVTIMPGSMIEDSSLPKHLQPRFLAEAAAKKESARIEQRKLDKAKQAADKLVADQKATEARGRAAAAAATAAAKRASSAAKSRSSSRAKGGSRKKKGGNNKQSKNSSDDGLEEDEEDDDDDNHDQEAPPAAQSSSRSRRPLVAAPAPAPAAPVAAPRARGKRCRSFSPPTADMNNNHDDVPILVDAPNPEIVGRVGVVSGGNVNELFSVNNICLLITELYFH